MLQAQSHIDIKDNSASIAGRCINTHGLGVLLTTPALWLLLKLKNHWALKLIKFRKPSIY